MATYAEMNLPVLFFFIFKESGYQHYYYRGLGLQKKRNKTQTRGLPFRNCWFGSFMSCFKVPYMHVVLAVMIGVYADP